jgi:transposase-like protein
MECKYCQGMNCLKNGHTFGFQRYNCKYCNRNWTLGKERAYSAEKRFEALKRYLEGLGFRSIGRIRPVA